MKLKNLELEEFDGGYLRFQTWWTIFRTMVHDVPTMTNDEKAGYLRQCLKGEPKLRLECMMSDGLNYPLAIQELHRLYGNTNRLVSEILDGFAKVPTGSGGILSYKTQFYKFMGAVKILQNLNLDVIAMTPYLLYTVVNKAPREIREKFNRHRAKVENRGDSVTIIDAMSYILELLESMDVFTIPPSRQTSSSDNKPSKQSHKSNKIQTFTSSVSKGKSQPNKGNGTSGNNLPNRPTQRKYTEITFCFNCGADTKHRVEDCPSAKNQRRKQIVILAKSQGVCFCCLSSRHDFNTCKERCKECNGKHHTMIHPRNNDVNRMRTFMADLSDDSGIDSDMEDEAWDFLDNDSVPILPVETNILDTSDLKVDIEYLIRTYDTEQQNVHEAQSNGYIEELILDKLRERLSNSGPRR